MPLTLPGADAGSGESLDVTDLTNSLRSLMVRNMGIVRDRRRMVEAQRDVEFWCRYVLTREFDGRAGWELQNLLTVARLMIDAALAREESRGTHFRSDFPARNDAWNRHVPSRGLVRSLKRLHLEVDLDLVRSGPARPYRSRAAVGRVGPSATVSSVVPVAAEQAIVAGVARSDVVPVAAITVSLPAPASNMVVPVAAEDAVVPSPTGRPGSGREPVQDVVPVAAE